MYSWSSLTIQKSFPLILLWIVVLWESYYDRSEGSLKDLQSKNGDDRPLWSAIKIYPFPKRDDWNTSNELDGCIKTPMACHSCIYQFKFWYINHLRRVAHTERMLLQTQMQLRASFVLSQGVHFWEKCLINTGAALCIFTTNEDPLHGSCPLFTLAGCNGQCSSLKSCHLIWFSKTPSS